MSLPSSLVDADRAELEALRRFKTSIETLVDLPGGASDDVVNAVWNFVSTGKPEGRVTAGMCRIIDTMGPHVAAAAQFGGFALQEALVLATSGDQESIVRLRQICEVLETCAGQFKLFSPVDLTTGELAIGVFIEDGEDANGEQDIDCEVVSGSLAEDPSRLGVLLGTVAASCFHDPDSLIEVAVAFNGVLSDDPEDLEEEDLLETTPGAPTRVHMRRRPVKAEA